MTVKNVVEDILKNGDVMFNMMDIRNYDEYIYYHSVNVGVLSIMVGATRFERSKLYDLGVAAMLHDIGKKFLPEEIANGKWPLEGAEREAWKSHPKLGAEYLSHLLYRNFLAPFPSYLRP